MAVIQPLPIHCRQRARRDQLDALRLARPLTDAERAEAERLTNALYLREWRRAAYQPRRAAP